MATRRTVRVSEAIKIELAGLIQRQRELEGMIITISAVDVTPDLKQAFVFISILEEIEHRDRILERLNKHAYEWQKVVSHRLGLKNTPRMTFRFDRGIERGDRIMQILNEIGPIEDSAPAENLENEKDN